MTTVNDSVSFDASETEADRFIFGGIDYLVFLIMLLISAAVGVYYGFFNKSENTTEEYLMGGRKMKTIPIAISLVASQLSAISIMTIPGEMYAYGFNYFFSFLTMIFNIPFLCWIVVPVFYNNNISNCYEYLELRFNRATRELITMAYMGTFFIILPVYNFVPSLAFAQVTNLNIHLINTVISSICVFYTMFGGIKAVVWTDVIQATIMAITVVFIGIMGVIKVGGLSKVFDLSYDGGRLDADLTFDLKSRMTFWNATMSSVCIWVSYVGYNQSCVQRIVSLPTLAHAKRSLIYFGFGFLLIMGFNCFTGYIMYALFHDCDPIAAGIVKKPDQLLPYFVQDVVGHMKGMPGLFIACVFSAALSTLSATMNAMSGVIYMDYIKKRIRHTESRANMIMKFIVLLFGIYCVIGGVIVEKLTSILQIMMTVGGISFGAVFAVFTLGMLVPKVHGRAAFWSIIASMIVMTTIVVGAQGRLKYNILPTSTDGCAAKNITISTEENMFLFQKSTTSESEEFNIFDLSFNWYIVFGVFLVTIFAIPLSYIMESRKDEQLDPKLLSPIVQRFAGYKLTQTHELEEIREKN